MVDHSMDAVSDFVNQVYRRSRCVFCKMVLMVLDDSNMIVHFCLRRYGLWCLILGGSADKSSNDPSESSWSLEEMSVAGGAQRTWYSSKVDLFDRLRICAATASFSYQ